MPIELTSSAGHRAVPQVRSSARSVIAAPEGTQPSLASIQVRPPVTTVILPGPPLLVGGLRTVLNRHRDRVELRMEGQDTEVMVTGVTHVYAPDSLPHVVKPLVVVVSAGDADTIALVRRRGAIPVPGTADGEQIVRAIEAARSLHGLAVPGGQANERREVEKREATLSRRETQTLGLICTGISNQQITREMHISMNSLKTYIRSMYRKIGVSSRTQAVMWGLRHGYGSSVSCG